jgi:hypothetical protein
MVAGYEEIAMTVDDWKKFPEEQKRHFLDSQIGYYETDIKRRKKRMALGRMQSLILDSFQRRDTETLCYITFGGAHLKDVRTMVQTFKHRIRCIVSVEMVHEVYEQANRAQISMRELFQTGSIFLSFWVRCMTLI